MLGYSTRIRWDQVPRQALTTAPSRPRLPSLSPCPDNKESNCAYSPPWWRQGPANKQATGNGFARLSLCVPPGRLPPVQIRSLASPPSWFSSPAPEVTGVGAGPEVVSP